MKLTFVLLGLLVLAGTAVGVKMTVDSRSAASGPTNQKPAESNQPPDKVLCWAFLDVEPGVAGLYPKQPGDVVHVARENTIVEAGDVLLQVDDKLAHLKIEEATADVKSGKQQLAEANHLTEFYKLQKEQQNALIKSIDLEKESKELERDRNLSTLEKSEPIYKRTVELYAKGFELLAEKKKAEKAKLKQLELQDAKLKITQAEADLEAKNVRLKQAQEMLKHFKIVAPSKGTVLRVYVRKGETLGPNPRIHAIDFLPELPIIAKAEVLQEWARFVKEGQEVEIEDDTYHGQVWKGKVKSISKWYAPPRSVVIEPLRYNDVRTLECIIEVTDAGNAKIGQRVRAKVKVN